jgi:hypothetical protein
MTTTAAEKPVYEVVTVKKIATPEGMTGDNWHRYVIRRKSSEITGMKPGTLKSVTQHADSVAEDLNLRAGGLASSTYAARKRT